jgi:hypothetical protein
MKSRSRYNIQKTITNEYITITPIKKKNITPIIIPKHVPNDIQTYVISHTGKLVKPRSPIGPPPPLPIKPICKNLNKKVL